MTEKLDLRAARLNVAAQAGKTWDIHITMPTGWNWTGYIVTWTLTAEGAATPALTATSGAGITLATESLDLKVTDELTAAIAAGTYDHEFILEAPGGDIPPFIDGKFTVS